MTEAASPKKLRRSLTHVGGEARIVGDAEVGAALAWALDVRGAPGGEHEEGSDRAHVHGFHAYPARLHPDTAARLVRVATRRRRATVLDPFAGSGTVLVEAMIAGARALGTDLNPLAVKLARCKTRLRTAGELDAIAASAARAREVADARRKARAGASRRYGAEDVALFDPHVLLELDGLRVGVDEERDPGVRADLALVLSSILVKVSRRAADTAPRGAEAPRRLAAGYTAKLFFRKAEELARRLRERDALLARDAIEPRVEHDDATRLESVQNASIDAIVTSPPYAGTYDYLDHHELRLRWLGLDARAFERDELGARRDYAALDVRGAGERARAELGAFFEAARRVLRPGGWLALVVADSAVGRGRDAGALRAEALVTAAARDAALELVACASQARPHFHLPTRSAFLDRPRSEHAIVLERA